MFYLNNNDDIIYYISFYEIILNGVRSIIVSSCAAFCPEGFEFEL